MFIRTNHNIRKYTFAGAVRAASSIDGAAAISTARRFTRHHEFGYSWLGVFRDVPHVTRLGNLSGLHERARIRGASVRTLTPRSAVLRMARRKPKKGYQATTRPSQETGTVQPGWPTLVMRLKKKVGNGGRTQACSAKQAQGLPTLLGSSEMCLHGDDRPIRRPQISQ